MSVVQDITAQEDKRSTSHPAIRVPSDITAQLDPTNQFDVNQDFIRMKRRKETAK